MPVSYEAAQSKGARLPETLGPGAEPNGRKATGVVPESQVGSGPAGERQAGLDAALEEARSYFGQDRFATMRLGARIDEAAPGFSACSLDICDEHRNAMGAVMGGAIFSLADFALAVASNFRQEPSVTVSSNVEFVAGARGSRLIARCSADRDGRRLGFYTTRVEDERGTLVALVHATCMRVGK